MGLGLGLGLGVGLGLGLGLGSGLGLVASVLTTCAAFQLVSTLPLPPSWSMKRHAAVTSSTPGGGLPG